MAGPTNDIPTPEQLESRLNDVAELYELGMALRELRLVDEPARQQTAVENDRVSDLGPDSSPRPDEDTEFGSRSGFRPMP
jgi:hypothetical protein